MESKEDANLLEDTESEHLIWVYPTTAFGWYRYLSLLTQRYHTIFIEVNWQDPSYEINWNFINQSIYINFNIPKSLKTNKCRSTNLLVA